MHGVAAFFAIGVIVAEIVVAQPRVSQAPISARIRLEQVAHRYLASNAGRLLGVTVVNDVDQASGVTTGGRLFSVSFATGGRVRQEALGPADALIVSDGRRTWIHRADYQQFKEIASGQAFRPAQIENLRRAATGLTSAVVVGDETLVVESHEVSCTVIDAEYEDDSTATTPRRRVRYWVEEGTDLVRQEQVTMTRMRQGEMRETLAVTTYSAIDLNAAFPESHFTFSAGPGDERVVEFHDPAQVDLTGSVAPDFELRVLDGESVSLASLRGRVVILDFWATWCVPCAVEMPTLQRLHMELKEQGVVVLGVNAEPPALARRFLTRHGVTFATLTDPRSAITRLYGVQGIPVGVIIDRNGRVRAHFPGLRDERTWRVALAPVLAEP